MAACRPCVVLQSFWRGVLFVSILLTASAASHQAPLRTPTLLSAPPQPQLEPEEEEEEDAKPEQEQEQEQEDETQEEEEEAEKDDDQGPVRGARIGACQGLRDARCRG